MFDFSERLVLITGAVGIHGRWIAAAFARAGARLCVTDRDQAALEALLREVAAPAGSFAVTADLTDAAEIERLAERVGVPNILVNNAGVYPTGFLLDIDVAEWDRVMAINLRAPFVLTRAVATRMIRAGKKGSIVNISSGAAHRMRRSVVPYCTSKAALERLTRGFALELAEFGIRVNAVEPGFAAGSAVSTLSEQHIATTTANIPLGRASGPDDAANAVLFLCSDAAAYITGQSLAADGGGSAGTMPVYQEKQHPL